MSFTERFQELLAQRNITTYKISKETDIGETLLGYWRRGERVPTLENLIKLADYFDISIDYLVGRSDNPERR